jgi:hypothetical protein
MVSNIMEKSNGSASAAIWHAPVAGLVATALMTVMMYKGAPMMIGKPMDIAAHLGAMMGDSWIFGMAAHFALGTIVFPLAFFFIGLRVLPGPMWLKGVVWGVALWLGAMIVVMPMTGGGFFMGAVPPAMASFVGHIVYGVVLGGVMGLLRR